jgi:hypothetical protein
MKRCRVNRCSWLSGVLVMTSCSIHLSASAWPLISQCSRNVFPATVSPSRRKKSVSPREKVFPSSPADAHVHSAIRASCKAARLYSGMASKHWKRSDITVHPFVPLKGCLVLMGKSLLRFPVRVAEMVCELNLQKKLCVRCVVRNPLFQRNSACSGRFCRWTGLLDSSDVSKTHRISHARQDLYSTRGFYIQHINFS